MLKELQQNITEPLHKIVLDLGFVSQSCHRKTFVEILSNHKLSAKIPKSFFFLISKACFVTIQSTKGTVEVLRVPWVSLIINEPIHRARSRAFTGAIDNEGNVSEVGGIPAKVNGAVESNFAQVFIPSDNSSDLSLCSQNVLEKIEIVTLSNIREILSKLKL